MEDNNSLEGSEVRTDRSHPYLIGVQVEPEFAADLDLDRLHELACYVLEAEGHREPVQLGITITGDTQIHELNNQYLGHDYPTDVLSFGSEGVSAGGRQVLVPSEEEEDEEYEEEDAEPESAQQFQFVTPPDWPRHLGDVVISYETAAAQAPDYGLSTAQEIELLLVHGILHLLGYDDIDPEARAKMHARQEELVSGFAAGA